MNKMGILLFIFTLLGIGGIYFHYNKTSRPEAPTVMYRVEPSSPAAPSNSDKSIPQSVEGLGSYSSPLPTPPSVSAPITSKAMGSGLDIETQKFYVKAIFSFLILVASLFVILKGGTAEAAKWAFGSVGTIIGYWLK